MNKTKTIFGSLFMINLVISIQPYFGTLLSQNVPTSLWGSYLVENFIFPIILLMGVLGLFIKNERHFIIDYLIMNSLFLSLQLFYSVVWINRGFAGWWISIGETLSLLVPGCLFVMCITGISIFNLVKKYKEVHSI
ncbi:hypothetical protein [Anaerorhabdus furcosa]|uniref:Uncharacterized protein n=1 Tax=Anaerorhabdus furcosa TaxID=118967 RepID=A0A1T4QCU3_9FIRM|nr:hypothetical protein [Anaerorhabdus furcosa]SKA01436.1 hypothetical protein SAMN02745191_2407 [Anaerorhabdus furcosa]